MGTTDTAKPGRPAKDHSGRQRKLHCAACGFLCYASAKAIRVHGAPSCGCGAGTLSIAHGRDAAKVSRAALLALALERDAQREECEAAQYAEQREREVRAEMRKGERERTYGFRPGAFRCSCGRFKPRPSSVCDYCGDSSVTHDPDLDRMAREVDRAYGYAA